MACGARLPYVGRMIRGFALLVLFQYLGQSLSTVSGLPLPGAVMGFFLLSGALLVLGARKTGRFGSGSATFGGLGQAGGWLLRVMPVLFIPAGVGIVTELPRLRAEWLPVLVGMVGSTVITFAVSALVMQRLARRLEPRATRPDEGGAR